jgi:hypothetical protein
MRKISVADLAVPRILEGLRNSNESIKFRLCHRSCRRGYKCEKAEWVSLVCWWL